MTTDQFIPRARQEVEHRLADLLEAHWAAAPPPPRILEALRYAVLGGGKRLRPLLVISAGEACRTDREAADRDQDDEISDFLLTAACAVEMIHTFSLIHDDLPALDDDDLRRGRAALHVRFDEATAILAGDALLNLAYEVLSRGAGMAPRRLSAIAVLSRGVGLQGMISGQVLDLEGEGAAVGAEAVQRIHALKTGALITACCEVGGILAGAPDPAMERLREYGRQAGLAFQIVDDILDVEGSAADLGKSPGKDSRAGKATFPAMWGLEESRRLAAECVDKACLAVSGDGLRGEHLAAIARGLLHRRS